MSEPSSTPQFLLEVEGLRKSFGPIKAVDDISFQVRRGDVLGFLGPNGAGKTTAMKMVTGFLEPDAGNVRVAGHDMATESLKGRQRLGYLPEDAPAYGEMTVEGFLRFVAEARQSDEPAGWIDRAVEIAHLRRVRHQTVETLSKGFKRRVGLAQALIHDPDVLILDEPTDGLDPNQKALVQELIANLGTDKAIVLSTHILDEAERVCNRALIISEGKILVDSTPEALIARAPNHNVIRVSVDAPAVEGLMEMARSQLWCERVVRHSETAVDVFPKGGENRLSEFQELVRDLEVHDLRLQEGRFDDLFREITQGVAA